MISRKRNKQDGFTLIEIVVVIAILSVFVAVIYSSFFGTVRAIRATEEMTDAFQPVQLVMQRIQRDLKGAIHRAGDERYVFNGIEGYNDSPELDRIDFITNAHIITQGGGPQSDTAEISYYIDKNNYDKGYLVRREDIYLDDEPDRGGELKIIAENVTGLNFKYFMKKKDEDEEVQSDKDKEKALEERWEASSDPENWLDEWDWEETPYLPRMVKIEITIAEEIDEGNYYAERKETTFSTIVFLNRDPSTVTKNTSTTTHIDSTKSNSIDHIGKVPQNKRGPGNTDSDVPDKSRH